MLKYCLAVVLSLLAVPAYADCSVPSGAGSEGTVVTGSTVPTKYITGINGVGNQLQVTSRVVGGAEHMAALSLGAGVTMTGGFYSATTNTRIVSYSAAPNGSGDGSTLNFTDNNGVHYYLTTHGVTLSSSPFSYTYNATGGGLTYVQASGANLNFSGYNQGATNVTQVRPLYPVTCALLQETGTLSGPHTFNGVGTTTFSISNMTNSTPLPTYVAYYVDGSPMGGSSTGPNFTLANNIFTLPNGMHTLTASVQFGPLGPFPTSNPTLVFVTASNVISANTKNTCQVYSKGALCWGDNSFGQIGNGSATAMFRTPQKVTGLEYNTGVTQIATGLKHACAVQAGNVRCWGDNSFGQLGDGTHNATNVPTPPINLGGTAISVAAGASHSCALLADGSIKCWGDNSLGQLGTNSQFPAGSSTPTPLQTQYVPANGTQPFPAGNKGISAKNNHTCLLSNQSGYTFCWGQGANGQIGLNGTQVYKFPVVFGGSLSPTYAVSAGYFNSCVATSGGLGKCSGDNSAAQLGTGASGPQVNLPVTSTAMGTVTSDAEVGGYFQCTRHFNDTIECVGKNDYGQLGDNTLVDKVNPAAIDQGDFLTAGMYHTCSLGGPFGGTRCWGRNESGQLGNNLFGLYQKVPVTVTYPP